MENNLPVMKGNAIHARGAGYFEVPLFSHIYDNLWMGCSPAEFPHQDWLTVTDPTTLLPVPRFDAILNLYQWGEYVVPKGTVSRVEEMYDAYGKVDHEQLEDLSDWVINQLKQGHKVLVHCQAGLNRSSLVAGRVLMKMFNFSGQEAIAKIRSQRSEVCLCNKDFESYLLWVDSEWFGASLR